MYLGTEAGTQLDSCCLWLFKSNNKVCLSTRNTVRSHLKVVIARSLQMAIRGLKYTHLKKICPRRLICAIELIKDSIRVDTCMPEVLSVVLEKRK